MPSHQFSGKSKEELVFVAQLSGLLSEEAASKMTKSALVAFLTAEDEKVQSQQQGEVAQEEKKPKAPAKKRTSSRTSDPKSASKKSSIQSETEKPATGRGRKPRNAAVSESDSAPSPTKRVGRRPSRQANENQVSLVQTETVKPGSEDKYPEGTATENEKPVRRKPGRKKALPTEPPEQSAPVPAQDTAPSAEEPTISRPDEPLTVSDAGMVTESTVKAEPTEPSAPAVNVTPAPAPRANVRTDRQTNGQSHRRPEYRKPTPTMHRSPSGHRERSAHLPAARTPTQQPLIPAHHKLIMPASQPPLPDQSEQTQSRPDSSETASVQAPLQEMNRGPIPTQAPSEQGQAMPGNEQSTENATLPRTDAEHGKMRRPFVGSGELVSGVLEIMPDGYGFLRKDNYLQGSNDIYVPPQYIRRFNLRPGDWVVGPGKTQRDTDRYQALLYIKEVNGLPPDKMIRRPQFDKLTPIYPEERFILETTRNELSTRIIDLVAPIGKGQRGMIVSPPKAGKTILLQKIANAISINNPETKLIVLLIDERPEEVTDMQRSINGEVVYSTFDKTPENHVKVTELVLERAMRLVELKQDVVILLDSITRMGRAYNLTINPTGRTLSGGLDPGALYGPKRFFGAARNIEGGGSLTIVATALIDTGSRMDEVIFEEFKGTGNMEVYLDRKLSEKRIFPAIDINRSGTRREELLLAPKELDAVWAIRKAFGQLDTAAVTEMIINLLLKTNNNQHFVSSINVSLNDKNVFEAMRGNRTGAQAQSQSQNGYGG